MERELCKAERKRLKAMSVFEEKLKGQGYKVIAGIDEAGRGPLAGPVVAAACILPENYLLESLNDSKQLSEGQREKLYCQIIQNPQIIFGVGIVEHNIIDEINILQATMLAMRHALENLNVKPEYILVDGNQSPTTSFPCECIIDGDARSISIAAASIIAKVTRDHIMLKYDKVWPQYNFKEHKGYPTSKHKKALKEFGPCEIHRRSFSPVVFD